MIDLSGGYAPHPRESNIYDSYIPDAPDPNPTPDELGPTELDIKITQFCLEHKINHEVLRALYGWIMDRIQANEGHISKEQVMKLSRIKQLNDSEVWIVWRHLEKLIPEGFKDYGVFRLKGVID